MLQSGCTEDFLEVFIIKIQNNKYLPNSVNIKMCSMFPNKIIL